MCIRYQLPPQRPLSHICEPCFVSPLVCLKIKLVTDYAAVLTSVNSRIFTNSLGIQVSFCLCSFLSSFKRLAELTVQTFKTAAELRSKKQLSLRANWLASYSISHHALCHNGWGTSQVAVGMPVAKSSFTVAPCPRLQEKAETRSVIEAVWKVTLRRVVQCSCPPTTVVTTGYLELFVQETRPVRLFRGNTGRNN